nr:hypothetical protein [Tanacetum cinerariifolium]
MEEVIKKRKGPMPFAMLLTRLYNHTLATNPQAIVPIARFTFHKHVMNLLDISRNHSTEKGNKIASPPVISSSSSSSDDNEAPSFLEFYDELSDSDNLTKEVIKKRKGPMPFAMLLTRLYNHTLATNPQAIVPIARFTFHKHVMNLLDILRNHSTEKGNKIASPPVISSSSSSSDDNEAPSFLEFYDELSDSDNLTKVQQEKRGMFKCLNR